MLPLIILYISAFIVALICVLFLFHALRAKDSAERIAGRFDWIQETLERAATQVNSDEEDEIIAGLQVIAQFNEPEIRVRLFRRIEDLRLREDWPGVAKQARWTKDAIVRQAVARTGDFSAVARKRPS